jgi:hypothetical protein
MIKIYSWQLLLLAVLLSVMTLSAAGPGYCLAPKFIGFLYQHPGMFLTKHLLPARAVTPPDEYIALAFRRILTLAAFGFYAGACLLILAAVRNEETRWALGACMIAFGLTFYSQSGALFNPLIVNDDARQHIWWMRKFRNASLFFADPLADYAVSLQNIGTMGFYFLASLVVDPVVVCKILPLFLMTATVFYIFRIAQNAGLQNLSALIVAAVFIVTSFYMDHTAGGHAHTFGFLLLSMFVFYLLREDDLKCGMLVVLETLFFPVLFPISVGTYLAAGLWGRRQKTKWRILVIAVFIGIALLGMKFFFLTGPRIGHVLTKPAILSMPELSAKGRWPVLPVRSVAGEIHVLAKESLFFVHPARFLSHAIKAVLNKTGIFLVLLAACLALKIRRIPSRFLMVGGGLFVTSLVLYKIAAKVMFRIYAPDRYFEYTIPFLALFALALPVMMAVEGMRKPRARGFIYAALILFLISAVPGTKNAGLIDASQDKKFYDFLAALPNDVLIAAPPRLADNIPIFCRKKVFLNEELSVPLYDRYWAMMRERNKEFWNAYYAADLKTIARFCRDHQIDYLIIDQRMFDPGYLRRRQFTFEPFNQNIIEHIGRRTQFALPLLSSLAVFRDGPYAVVNIHLIHFGDP